MLGSNNYTGIIREYQSGIYQKFHEVRYLRHKTLSEAARNHKAYKYAEEPDRMNVELLIYTTMDRFQGRSNDPNRVYEFYYGLDEVKFRSDEFTKCQILSQKICDPEWKRKWQFNGVSFLL